jgi:hypothetical protein
LITNTIKNDHYKNKLKITEPNSSKFDFHIQQERISNWGGDAYMILVGKPEGKRPPGKQRRRWLDNIKRDLEEIGWHGVDWIDLA